jgi:hypothetical protein
MTKRKKRYTEMTAAELAEATGAFDEDFAFLNGRPLTSAERKLHANARRRGRPRLGRGAEKIRISVERGLLEAADAYAKMQRMTRSEMVARGLRAVLVAGGYYRRARPALCAA